MNDHENDHEVLLNQLFGQHVGLNADWSVTAWHLGPHDEPNIASGDFYLIDSEECGVEGRWFIVRREYDCEITGGYSESMAEGDLITLLPQAIRIQQVAKVESLVFDLDINTAIDAFGASGEDESLRPFEEIGFDHGGCHILNPLRSECLRFEVDPVKYYGLDNVLGWVYRANLHLSELPSK